MNKEKESFQPYDFEIIVIKDGQQKIRHLEVKTSTAGETTIDVSYSTAEWEQMLSDGKDNGKSYRLFVVKAHINEQNELIIDQLKKLNFSKHQNQIAVADVKKLTINL